MINYPKIPSLFKRDPKTQYSTFLPEYSCPEFEYLKDCDWEWVEKIDGTNIKLYLPPVWQHVEIGGRTGNAQLPPHLLEYLQDLVNKKTPLFREIFETPVAITLYGEGYGPKINGGDQYRKNVSFILFDILVGNIWLKRGDVRDIGEKLGIEVAPTVFLGTCKEGELFVSHGGFPSLVPFLKEVYPQRPGTPPCSAEGLVGQPLIPLCNRLGKRIITKLKTKDFQND